MRSSGRGPRRHSAQTQPRAPRAGAVTNRNCTLGYLLSFTGIGIFTTSCLSPLFLGCTRGFGASQIGLAVFSTGAASPLGTPVYLMLAKRFNTRWLMAFGLASFAANMWSYSFITHDWSPAELL